MNRNIEKALQRWQSSKNRKPLILQGARQVGKTYSLINFGETSFSHCHYLNFEVNDKLKLLFEKQVNPSSIIDELQLYLDAEIDRKTDLVIFDEIQHCPKALTSLKYFCEQMPDLALCAAGSLLGVYLSDASFPVGKVALLNLYPMNFEEFIVGTGHNRLVELIQPEVLSLPLPDAAHDRLWNLWKRYLIVGGLPGAVSLYRDLMEDQYKAITNVREMQRDLLDTYMADIAKHSGKANALHIERLWRNVTHQLARSQDGSAGKFRFKDAVPGIRGYEKLITPLSWLEKSHLILRTSIVERAETPLSAYAQENRFKQYFFDVGLLGALSGIDPAFLLAYNFDSYKGFVAENYVAQELRASDSRDLYCWMGRTSEVEFLIETSRGIVPVEVKAGRITQSKSLNVYEDRYEPKTSVVLSARNLGSRGRRIHIPLYLAGRLKEYITRRTG